jgi:hypothetical protein
MEIVKKSNGYALVCVDGGYWILRRRHVRLFYGVERAHALAVFSKYISPAE